MKKIFFALVSLVYLQATAQVKMPAASPTQTISQEFGLGKIELVYSRPSLKGRAVFGKGSLLAPTGVIWRTGANNATKISFTDKVILGGKSIAAGEYALFTIPGEKEWTIIINTNTKSWGSFDYKESDDIVRLKVKTELTNAKAETLTMGVGNITPESATISLSWGNVLINIPIQTEIKATIRKQIEESTNGTNVKASAFSAAANFYYDLDKDYNKGLVCVNKAIEGTEKAYWLFLLKAKIQKELKDKKGAKESAAMCVKLATDAKNDDYIRSGNEIIAGL